MRRTLVLAALACSLAGCNDALGVGDSSALFRIDAHSHVLTAPGSPSSDVEDHNYHGMLWLRHPAGGSRSVVMELRECSASESCPTRLFESVDTDEHYERTNRFHATLLAQDDQSPRGFDIEAVLDPGGFSGQFDQIGTHRTNVGSFTATPR